jgi:hypothetical protein
MIRWRWPRRRRGHQGRPRRAASTP